MPPEAPGDPHPSALPRGPEMGLPRELLGGGEHRLYPIEEEDLVDMLAVVDVGEGGDVTEITGAVQLALGFREGLVYGNEGYSLEGPEAAPVILKLQNDFTTLEESTERPRDTYLTPAIKRLLGTRVREAKLSVYNRELWEKMMRRKYPQASDDEFEGLLAKERLRVENYKRASNRIIALENHIDARRVLDTAFVQRMETCTSPETAAELMNKGRRYEIPATPDKGHWKAYFEGEWGEKVDEVFWEIVKFGLPDSVALRVGMDPIPPDIRDPKKGNIKDSIYVDGFPDTTKFKVWLGHLLKKANGRLDIVWAAWKLSLTTEVVDSVLGEKVKKDKDDPNGPGVYDLIIPPLGNALFTFAAHLNEKRTFEFGLKIDGKTRTKQVARYISHSGLPMSFGHLPDLCRSFLQESDVSIPVNELIGGKGDKQSIGTREETFNNLVKNLPKPGDPDYPNDPGGREEYEKLARHLQYLKDKKEGKEKDPNDPEAIKLEKEFGEDKSVRISLWNLAFYGRLGFAGRGEGKEKFPWLMTEEITSETIPGEVAPGSFDGWLLRRFRANTVKEIILSRPSLRDLGDPDFFVKQIRNTEKIWGKLEADTLPEKNPRNWLLAGWLYLHFGGTQDQNTPLIREDNNREFRITARSEALDMRPAGREERDVAIGDVLQNALNCGYIRDVDAGWLKEKLKLKII